VISRRQHFIRNAYDNAIVLDISRIRKLRIVVGILSCVILNLSSIVESSASFLDDPYPFLDLSTIRKLLRVIGIVS
jgi:hypothetical protein